MATSSQPGPISLLKATGFRRLLIGQAVSVEVDAADVKPY